MNQLWWYAARASGLVSWALLAGSVVLGLALSSRAFGRRPHPAWLLDLHRYLGGLAVVFVAVHVTALAADSYVHFGLSELLVPLASRWHPVAVAWGVVALWLLAAVELTSLARRRLPRRLWRQVHYASFPLFALTTIHGLTAGSDAGRVAAVLVATAAFAAVAALAALRVKGAVVPVPLTVPADRRRARAVTPLEDRDVRSLH